MLSLLENFINGNISFSQKKAKRYSRLRLTEFLNDFGYDKNEADKIVSKLKDKQ